MADRKRTAASAAGGFAVLGAACLLATGLAFGPSGAQEPPKAPAPQDEGAPQDIQVPAPPFTEGIFPCTQCHDGKTVKLNTTRRKLVDMHDDIVLQHGPASRWCLDCHDPQDRDKLRLASGERIEFSRSYLLCGQCHGDKFRDWRVGVHGKRTGEWNGKKQYLLCVHCHYPHAPHFKPIKPLPPPVRPETLRGEKGAQP